MRAGGGRMTILRAQRDGPAAERRAHRRQPRERRAHQQIGARRRALATAAAKAVALAKSVFIFQFPAINGVTFMAIISHAWGHLAPGLPARRQR